MWLLMKLPYARRRHEYKDNYLHPIFLHIYFLWDGNSFMYSNVSRAQGRVGTIAAVKVD